MKTNRLSDPATIAALLQLAPAGRAEDGEAPPLTVRERGRADATLERVLSSAPTDPGTGRRSGPAPSGAAQAAGPLRRSWPIVLGTVALAAVLAVPGLVTGRDRAYASWTPKPVQLSATESAAAVNTCLAAHDLSGKPAAQ